MEKNEQQIALKNDNNGNNDNNDNNDSNNNNDNNDSNEKKRAKIETEFPQFLAKTQIWVKTDDVSFKLSSNSNFCPQRNP